MDWDLIFIVRNRGQSSKWTQVIITWTANSLEHAQSDCRYLNFGDEMMNYLPELTFDYQVWSVFYMYLLIMQDDN